MFKGNVLHDHFGESCKPNPKRESSSVYNLTVLANFSYLAHRWTESERRVTKNPSLVLGT
jgi:hypothetical protein